MLAWLLIAGVNGVAQKASAQEYIKTETTQAQKSTDLNSPSLSPINPMAQVTSVSQLKDVQPNDWSFQALQSLVERYGCIARYPDSSYRGNRALTRYKLGWLY